MKGMNKGLVGIPFLHAMRLFCLRQISGIFLLAQIRRR